MAKDKPTFSFRDSPFSNDHALKASSQRFTNYGPLFESGVRNYNSAFRRQFRQRNRLRHASSI